MLLEEGFLDICFCTADDSQKRYYRYFELLHDRENTSDLLSMWNPLLSVIGASFMVEVLLKSDSWEACFSALIVDCRRWCQGARTPSPNFPILPYSVSAVPGEELTLPEKCDHDVYAVRTAFKSDPWMDLSSICLRSENYAIKRLDSQSCSLSWYLTNT